MNLEGEKVIQNNEHISKFWGYLYFIWGLLVLFQQTVNYSFPRENTIIKIVNVIILIALIVYEIIQLEVVRFKISISSLCCIILFLMLGVLASYHQYGLTFLVAFLFMIVGSNVDFNVILKPFLGFSSLILIGTIILNKLGKIPDYYIVGSSQRIRSALGFSYYSFAAQITFYFISAYLVYRNKRITYIEITLLAILNIYVYYYTNTRNPFILTSFFLIYCLCKKIFHFDGIIYTSLGKYIVSFIFPLCFIILCWITFKLPPSIFERLNTALSGRLVLNINGLQMWGVHLWGQKINFYTIDSFGRAYSNYNYVDSAYFQNLIINGGVFFSIIMLFFTLLCLKVVERKKDTLAVALSIIAMHAMFDPQLIWPWFSPFFLLIGSLFPLNQQLNKRKSKQGKQYYEGHKKLSL